MAVSSQAYHKNFTGLINAFNNLCKSKKTDLSLIIVGGSCHNLRKQSYNTFSNASIHFVGKVTDEKLIKLYQEATAFIFPSLYEGFGIPPLEAQACGCPVVVSNAASMPEVLGDSVVFFDPANTSQMQDTICRVTEDISLRKSLMERGLSNVNRFSWEDSAQKLYEIIRKHC
jgi:glycosyltransferase involved in cell wall biosynthesis